MLQFFTGKTDTAPGIQADSDKTDKNKQAGVPGTKQGAEKTDTTNLSSKGPEHSKENTELASIFAGEVKNKQGSHLSASVGNFKIVLKLCQMAEALDKKRITKNRPPPGNVKLLKMVLMMMIVTKG